MGLTSLLVRLELGCKQYGPGRLPKADRHDIGAGYAGAAAALGIAVLFALLMLVLDTVSSLPDGDGWVFAAAALLSIPIVVPMAFLMGTFVTRALPKNLPYPGAVAGLLGTIGTYLGAVVALFAYGIVGGVAAGSETVLVDAAYFAATIGAVGFVLTCWLAIPVGCVSGLIYERVSSVT